MTLCCSALTSFCRRLGADFDYLSFQRTVRTTLFLHYTHFTHFIPHLLPIRRTASVKICRNYPRDLVVVHFVERVFRFRSLSLIFDVACGLISVKISRRVGRFITINIWIGRTRKCRPQRRFPTCFSL